MLSYHVTDKSKFRPVGFASSEKFANYLKPVKVSQYVELSLNFHPKYATLVLISYKETNVQPYSQRFVIEISAEIVKMLIYGRRVGWRE